MIKDIVVNLGLGANDPAGNYAVSVAELRSLTCSPSPFPTSR